MANIKKKNPKRLECLKKKAKELSILCDVEVLFLCEEDDDPSSNSFASWPEDRNSCLSLISKYKNSSVPAKSCNKKTVLGKRKERSDAQTEEFSEKVQANGEFEVGFVDGVDFDDFYAKFCVSQRVDFDSKFCGSVEETQGKNFQENGEFEVGFVDGVDFDDFYGKFCGSVEEAQGKSFQENGEFEVGFVDGVDFDSKFCGSIEESQSKNAQENVEFEMGCADGIDFDDFFGKFCESVEKTQLVLYSNVQDFDDFDLDFLEGLAAFDENRVSQESEKSKIITCEKVHKLEKNDLGNFVEGLAALDENRQVITESETSEIVESQESDAIINVLGHQQLLHVLTCLDVMLDKVQPQNR